MSEFIRVPNPCPDVHEFSAVYVRRSDITSVSLYNEPNAPTSTVHLRGATVSHYAPITLAIARGTPNELAAFLADLGVGADDVKTSGAA